MGEASAGALERARKIRLMLFDVDGVLTDGHLWYGPLGTEIKAFHGFDGHGIKMLASSGVRTGIITGRKSKAVALRARELGIEHVMQGIEHKRGAFEDLLASLSLGADAAGYMGDDLVDLPVLVRCGLACAPPEAPQEVRSRVHYVASAPAGRGAAREVCELVMRAQGSFERALAGYLK